MARIEVYDYDWSMVFSDSTSSRMMTTGMWIRAAGATKARVTIEVRNITNNFECIGAFQTSNDETSPDAGTNLLGSTWISANSTTYPAAWTDISTTVDGKQLIRFGVATRNASGTVTNFARVRVRLELWRE